MCTLKKHSFLTKNRLARFLILCYLSKSKFHFWCFTISMSYTNNFFLAVLLVFSDIQIRKKEMFCI